MPKLEVSMTLELEGILIFERWLPLKEEEAIVVNEGNVNTRIQIKVESTWWASHWTEEEISKWTNVGAHRLYITSTAILSDELSQYIIMRRREAIIMQKDEEMSGADKKCIVEYRQLGLDMQKTIVSPINRLIDYARAIKGQFQIEPIVPDYVNPGQFFMKNKTSANIDGRLIDFNPDYRLHAISVRLQDTKTFIKGEEWPDVMRFIQGAQRAPLVGALLATAKALVENDSRRNAIVDAVTALEIALSEFVDQCGDIPSEDMRVRFNTDKIKTLCSKLGLRGSFDVLLPMLFEESELPIEMLRECRKAVDARNNVVHHGARAPIDTEVRAMLRAIDECCRRFRDIIRSRAGSGASVEPD